MPLVDLSTGDEVAAAVRCIDRWMGRALATPGLLVAGERQEVTDRTASHRWYLRFAGEDKDFITVWLTLRQRTLHHEAQLMPAPEHDQAAVLAYLMRSNATLYGMSFCLGPEDAVYLVGKVPAALIDDDELDRIAGSSVLYVDQHFATAMTLAHPGLFRRRRRP